LLESNRRGKRFCDKTQRFVTLFTYIQKFNTALRITRNVKCTLVQALGSVRAVTPIGE